MHSLRDYARAYALTTGDRAIDDYEPAKDVLLRVPELRSFIGDPSITIEMKKRALQTAARLNDVMTNFVLMLGRDGALQHLDRLGDLIREEAELQSGSKTATAYSVLPLTKVETTTLKGLLEQLHGIDIKISNTIDTTILGGLKIEIGDWKFDASVKQKLALMNQRLKR